MAGTSLPDLNLEENFRGKHAGKQSLVKREAVAPNELIERRMPISTAESEPAEKRAQGQNTARPERVPPVGAVHVSAEERSHRTDPKMGEVIEEGTKSAINGEKSMLCVGILQKGGIHRQI